MGRDPRSRQSWLVRAAGAVPAAIGGAHLLAWLGGVAARWSAAGALTMKTNMALALLLAGVALIALEPAPAPRARRGAALVLGGVVFLIGALTLSEHLVGWDLGLDQLLAAEAPGAVGTASPNRIGPPGSISLTLLGLGILLAALGRPVAAYLGLATLVVVIVPAIGFLYGLSPFFATRVTGIAWPTVVGLLALSAGVMASPREGSPFQILSRGDPGGELVRRLLLPAIAIPIVLGYLRVQGERHGLYAWPTGTGLYAVALILLLSAVLWVTGRQLSAQAALRDRAVDRLAEEKERLAVTLRSIGDAVIATDTSGRITLLNGVAEALTGWTAGAAVGRPLEEVFRIVGGHTRQPVASPVDRVLREGGVVGLANHTVLIARDGTERPIADSGAPIRDAAGALAGVVLVFRDQTGERAAEAALARERTLLTGVMDATDVMLAYLNPAFELVWVNAAYAAAARLRPDELQGRNHFALYPHAENEAIFRRVRETGEPAFFKDKPFEYPDQPERGTTYWDWSLVPVKGPAGEVVGLVFSLRETTPHVLAAGELRASEARFKAVQESSPDGFVMFRAVRDGAGRIVDLAWTYANGPAERAAGVAPGGLLGRRLLVLYPGHAKLGLLDAYARVLETGAPLQQEVHYTEDGQDLLLRVMAVRVGDGLAVSFVDLTDRLRAEEALREADRRKDEFLGMLSHELRNPLAPIRSSIFVLERADPASPEAARARVVIRRQAEHLTRIVDDLLDVTRIAQGKIELHRARLDLRTVAADAVEDFRRGMEEKGVTLRAASPDRPVWVDGDATRLTQLVGNLLHNAAKFTPRGGEVSLTVSAPGPDAEIAVADTGAGIDPALLPRVFDPFVQGDRSLARTEGGLGLGLAVVRSVAELHGGTARAESAGAGQGARFVVRLPLADAAAPQQAAGAAAPGRGHGRRVLVVDDNHDAAESLAEIVALLGHEPAVAFDGPAAVDRARAGRFDTVLCDLGLPGFTGFEVARALRAAYGREIRLIAVSGYAGPESVSEALAAGFDEHVAKPCDPAQLERLLG